MGDSLGACVLAMVLASAASASPPAPALRTPDGAPDLQGVWSNSSITPLERLSGFDALELDPAQAVALEKRLDRDNHTTRNGPLGQYESEWHEIFGLARVNGKARSSVIVDPTDGRLPYSAEGRARINASRGAPLNGPEDSTASERCLSPGWSAAGPPMLTPPYSPNYKIVQTKDQVVILAEVNSTVRTIPLNASHGAFPLWAGDSIGRWDGDSLIVETINFAPGDGSRPPIYTISPQAKVMERFTRLSPTELRYSFTVDDPAMYSRPWSGEVPFHATSAPMFEYACHEGNYSMPGMLAGARRDERIAAEASGAKAP